MGLRGGTILGESTVGHYGYLTTEKTYSNFELRVKFNPEKGNSGVFTRSRITGDTPETGPDIEGMQVEVDPTRNTGSIYESGHRGWVAMGTPECEHAIKPGEWNDLQITEQGVHYVTALERRALRGLYRSKTKLHRRRNRLTTSHGRRSQDSI